MSNDSPLHDLVDGILSGWIRILKILGGIGIGVAAAAALGILIVLPLWLLASRAVAVYNVIVALLVVAVVAFRTLRHLAGRTSGSLLPILRKSGAVAVSLGGVYVFAILVWEGIEWAAALVGLLFVVWMGVLFSRRKPSPR